MTTMSKFSMAIAGAAFVSLGVACVNAPAVNAAIVAVGDSGSWVAGSNTLANQGFNMVNVSDNNAPNLGLISTLSSPVGNVTLGSEVEKRTIGSSWNTWSNGYSGDVYYNRGATNLEITMPFDVAAFDLYLQPEQYKMFEIAVTVMTSTGLTTTTLAQNIDGKGGAKYFGFYGTDGDVLKSITITDKSGGAAKGFAFAQMRIAPVPEPLMIGGSLLALGFGWRMKKKLASSKSPAVKS